MHPSRPSRPPLAPRRSSLQGSADWEEPWVQLKYFSFHPNIFPNMIAAASPGAKRGDVVTVRDKEGRVFGHGFFNPDGRVPLRIFKHGDEALAPSFFPRAIQDALDLRLQTLRLPDSTDAFRVFHSDGDGIPGLSVDKFGDVLSVEASNVAVLLRLAEWLPAFHARLGTTQTVVRFDDNAARAEQMRAFTVSGLLEGLQSGAREARVTELGVRYAVDFESGHKTGFFCDQRLNRFQFAQMVRGRRVLDVCCYTGGFSVAAKVLGAEEVTGVDLDEKAVAQAKKNANLNQARVSFVHADAFSWMRQMQRNAETWDAVVLDPPKLIHSRDGIEEGRARYHDFNKLALSLVKRGGLFVTCSCSGLMPVEVFEEIVIGLAHRSGRKLQILDRTGAGPDHPVMSNCPESRYLKLLWARVW